jgi:flagellar basal-body rod modification protein FlgD
MSAVDSISTSSSSTSTTSANGFSTLSSGDFLKIIFTELSRQDPTQPSDSKALLEQLSTIRNIQSSTDLSDKLTSLVSQNEFAGASQLIGKAVSGVTQDNTRKLGIVSGVSKTSKGSVVILDDGSRIDFKNIDEVQDIAEISPKTTGAAA